MVRGSAPKSAKLIVNGKVMVIYAAAGSNRAAAGERALKALYPSASAPGRNAAVCRRAIVRR
jgi:hypothetical protein